MNENAQVQAELEELGELVEQLRSGKLTPEEFRGRSVHYGVYTQRQPKQFFVRWRVLCGTISAVQLEALAEGARRWSDGGCHLTTRQGVELHCIGIEGLMPLLASLAKVDLLSHETGGNAVRGVLVCPHSGFGEDEPFDVVPYAEAVTRVFVRHSAVQQLPRKVKIGFSCCAHDCAHTALQDLGFQARINEGAPGFRVLVGGGTGTSPRLGHEFLPFLPADRLLLLVEAFLRVFDRHGDRQNRSRARTKFLVERLGVEGLRDLVQRELEGLGRYQPKNAAPEDDLSATRVRWGSVSVRVPGGNLEPKRLRGLASLMREFAAIVRLRTDQGLSVFFPDPSRRSEVVSQLDALNMKPGHPAVVACPGVTTCSNAFTNAPGLAHEILRTLSSSLNQVCTEADDIRICGCPNGCALHPIGTLGFSGQARRRGSEWIPAYRVWIGGESCQEGARLGTAVGSIPARCLPSFLARLTGIASQERRTGEPLSDFLVRTGPDRWKSLVREYSEAGAREEAESVDIDWGETAVYQPPRKALSGVC